MGDITVGEYKVSLRKALGRGTFGSVYPGVNKDGQQIAAKQIDCRKKKSAESAEKEREAFNKLRCEHENIIKIYDVLPDEYNDMWFMMELCIYGDLHQYFNEHPDKVKNVNHKLDMMCQIATGLKFLHEKNIVHRDIKPNNILVATNQYNLELITIKIADFGLCKYLDPTDSTSCMHTEAGTNLFKAPEFFNRRSTDGVINYRRSVDIFAAGLTFLAMIQPIRLSGRLMPEVEGSTLNDAEMPFPIGHCMMTRMLQDKQIILVVEKQDFPHVENMIRRVIRRACDSKPTYRITASQMLEYLEKIKSNPGSEVEALTPAGNIVTQTGGQTPPGSMRPAGATPFSEPSMQQIALGGTHAGQFIEAPTAQLGAIPIDRHEAIDNQTASGAAGHFKPAIPEGDLMKISGKVPPSKLTQFAIMYLGTNMSEINTAKERWREQVELANFEILRNWVQRNPGVTKHKLYNLLCEGSKRGWISRDVYSFLIEPNH